MSRISIPRVGGSPDAGKPLLVAVQQQAAGAHNLLPPSDKSNDPQLPASRRDPAAANAFVSDIAFSPAVKAVQARLGSRAGYARMAERGDWADEITPDLADFIAQQDSLFLATASALGQPYVQHRGGPPGFLRVLDSRTLAFADFAGNRQYITVGNLGENPKAQLFLIDYASRTRVKIWGVAECRDDTGLLAALMPPGYQARGERVIVFHVRAWDANCPQHIPRRVDPGTLQR